MTFFFNLAQLRAPDRKYQKSHDRSEISDFILFHLNVPFGELFSKIRKVEFTAARSLQPPEKAANCASLASLHTTMRTTPVILFRLLVHLSIISRKV